MNYRHAYHAGNFADVVKHVALVAALLHLKKKDTSFRVIDCHAGRGLYDLRGDEAARTGEASRGIGRIGDLAGRTGLPASLTAYLACVHAEGEGRYPGSPRIAARLQRSHDSLVAIEKHPDEAAALATALAPFQNAKAIFGDCYARMPALLPPRERRGLLLVDPPFEALDEFAQGAELLARAYSLFPTGIYLQWFPIKSKGAAESFRGEVIARGMQRSLLLAIEDGRGQDESRLSAAGLLVVNPPFGFEEEMRATSDVLAPRLGCEPGLRARINVARLGTPC